ncbi:hypothetical protein Esti_002869 [Eimeria stiedai]
MEVAALRTEGPHAHQSCPLALPLELLLEQQTLHPEMMRLTSRNGEKKRLGNGRLVLHAALSLGLPACVAVAAVGPIDRFRILKQTRVALMQQQQQHAALQQKVATRKAPFWLGAGCGSLTSLLACGTSVSALHFLRRLTSSRDGGCGKAEEAALLGASCAAALAVCHPIDLSRTLLLAVSLEVDLRRNAFGLIPSTESPRACASAVYRQAGLAGLYCGLPWGLVSLIPYAGAAAWLHAPCLSLLTNLNQRFKCVQQNCTTAGEQHPSPNGELHALERAVGLNGDCVDAEPPEGSLHASIPPTQQPSAAVVLSAAYVTTRAAQVLAYPFETIRRRMQVAAFCEVVGTAATGGGSDVKKQRFLFFADLCGLRKLPPNQRLQALRERTQRGLTRVLYGQCHESAAASAAAAVLGMQQHQQKHKLVLGPLRMMRSLGLHAASSPLFRGCWAGLPLLLIKTIPEGLVLLLTARLLFIS